MSVKYEYNIIGDKLYGNACYGMKRCLYKGTYGTPSLRMRHIQKLNFARKNTCVRKSIGDEFVF